MKEHPTYYIGDIVFKVIYSGRMTIGISILPDSSVIVRAPYLTSLKTIFKVVQQKAEWIIKHRDGNKAKERYNFNLSYITGEVHLFRGRNYTLRINKSNKSYISFNSDIIEVGLKEPTDQKAVKRLLYKGYKNEAMAVFPEIFSEVLTNHEDQMFKPAGLVIRTMKRRWGSCSNKGVITLSTELIKLPDLFVEYVIIHELCHLKHHNHGSGYYTLLNRLSPDWKLIRNEMKKYYNH